MPGRLPVVPLALAVALALLLAAGPVPAAPVPLGGSTHVHITGFAFSPATVSILAGETVTWHNHDGAPHDATAEDASWFTPVLLLGESSTLPFPSAATFGYLCSLHNDMLGTLVVNQPGALPDLVVAGLDAEPEVPGLVQAVHVTVRNLGLSEAPPSTLELVYLHQGEEHPVGLGEVPLLGPGATHEVLVQWFTAGKVGDFPVLARADAQEAVAEADEANNAAQAVVPLVVAGAPPVDLLDPLAG